MSITELFVPLLLLTTFGAASAQSDPHEFDRGAMMQDAETSGFSSAEEKFLAAAGLGQEDAELSLAQFYMANELWVEALSRIGGLTSPQAQALSAECEFRIGRYKDVVKRLGTSSFKDPLLPMALARLGAYPEARAAFENTAPASARSNLGDEFLYLKAEALSAAGAADDAAKTLLQAANSQKISASRRDFVLGNIQKVRGDRFKALASWRRAAAGGENEWSMRARLALAVDAGDVSEIDNLSIRWRGGAFERDLQLELGRLRLASNDFDRGFRALGKVVDRYPESQAAIDAQELIASTLPMLFAEETGLHPRDAARLFFEHVEFAPPGREGDVLIQEAADKLKALGLYRQAAMLLDHQVFKRLRGQERAIIAADLADLHLAAGSPADALRVIRATRIAGLPDEMNARRRRIEAKALAEEGKAESSVTLLSISPVAEDILLRAEINWSRRDWQAAAHDYSAYVSTLGVVEDKRDRTAAVRAATSYLLAGDRQSYRAFALGIRGKLNGAPEGDLIETLGDVDQSQFLSKIIDTYKATYVD